MEVVLGMMESNFSVAFKKSDAYKKFEQDVQREADELSRLQKVRIAVPVQCGQECFLVLVIIAILAGKRTKG